jgi:hypothetical protein
LQSRLVNESSSKDRTAPVAPKVLSDVSSTFHPPSWPVPLQVDSTRNQDPVSTLSAPVSTRSIQPPVLKPQISFDAKSGDQIVPETPGQSQPKISAPSFFLPTPSPFNSSSLEKESPHREGLAVNVLPVSAVGPIKEKTIDKDDLRLQHQLLYEQQERLLKDELIHRETERKVRLDKDEQEREDSIAMERQLNLARKLLREKESDNLKDQKMAAKEMQLKEQIKAEELQAQRQKEVEFYAEEIVRSIILEHILAINADTLATAFHQEWLLRRAMRQLKSIAARSIWRKRLLMEQIAQSKFRKRQLSRALDELDKGESSAGSKKLRRKSHGFHLEDEDAFEEIILKVERSISWLIIGKSGIQQLMETNGFTPVCIALC